MAAEDRDLGGRLQKLALGMWNIPSLKGKESELVCNVKKFRINTVGLNAWQGLSSTLGL